MLLLLLLAVWTCAFASASAQTADPPQPDPPANQQPLPGAELNVVNIPTTQPLKRHGHYFRITHRFARDLRRGSFGQLAEDLFSLDNGAIIGLDYRFAPTASLQLGAYRSMLFKTIQLSGRYDVWQEAPRRPLSLSLIASVEGDDNLSEHHQPGAGFSISHRLGNRIAVYAAPMFVWNTPPPGTTGHEDHDHEHPELGVPEDEGRNTAFIGLGTRVRILRTTFVSAEYSPRVAGYAPDRGTWGAAIEKHTRGHMFQLNFTNSFGTTFGQIARGGDRHNVYLGFNIARRF